MEQSDVRYSELKAKFSIDDGSTWSVNNTNDTTLLTKPSNNCNIQPKVLVTERELPNNNSTVANFTIKQDLDQEVGYSQPNKLRLKSEKTLVFIIVFLFVANFIIGIGVINHYMNLKNGKIIELENPSEFEYYSNLSKYCLTNECILASSSIYNSLNQNIDPCDNFYEYACGSWLQKTLIPSGFPRWGKRSYSAGIEALFTLNYLNLTLIYESNIVNKRQFS